MFYKFKNKDKYYFIECCLIDILHPMQIQRYIEKEVGIGAIPMGKVKNPPPELISNNTGGSEK